jgi:hypothetical protein
MIRSKFALHIAVACAASFAAGGQATVSGDFTGLVAIGGGRKILSRVPCHLQLGAVHTWHFSAGPSAPSNVRSWHIATKLTAA